MSALSKALRSERIGRLPEVLNVHRQVIAADDNHRLYDQYRISATFRCNVAMPAGLDIDDSTYIAQATRNITEAVFGEFRDPMLQIMNYISDNKPDKALEVANQIYETMFNE